MYIPTSLGKERKLWENAEGAKSAEKIGNGSGVSRGERSWVASLPVRGDETFSPSTRRRNWGRRHQGWTREQESMGKSTIHLGLKKRAKKNFNRDPGSKDQNAIKQRLTPSASENMNISEHEHRAHHNGDWWKIYGGTCRKPGLLRPKLYQLIRAEKGYGWEPLVIIPKQRPFRESRTIISKITRSSFN